MEKIKLGILNSSPKMASYGGVGPFVKNLDPFLSEAFDVTYITLPPVIHDRKFLPRRLMFALFLLYKFRSFQQYNFILSHVPEGSYITSFTKTPLIHIFHGNDNPMTLSRFWYGRFFEPVFEAFKNRIFKKSRLIYTVGKEEPNTVKILNPVLHSISVKDNSSRAGFIFAGRLEKGKNIDKIIRIYALLDAEITGHHPLYITGSGSQELVLKQLVDELNLTGKVIFTGQVTNDELIASVSYKKILLMASSKEGLPMAIVESLSVGVPVISTDAGDISRALQDNYNGFLLPIEFDMQDYARKIGTVLANYDQFAANALKSSKMFRAESVAGKLIDDISQLAR